MITLSIRQSLPSITVFLKSESNSLARETYHEVWTAPQFMLSREELTPSKTLSLTEVHSMLSGQAIIYLLSLKPIALEWVLWPKVRIDRAFGSGDMQMDTRHWSLRDMSSWVFSCNQMYGLFSLVALYYESFSFISSPLHLLSVYRFVCVSTLC